MIFKLKFTSVQKKLPPDDDWELLKMKEGYTISGFKIGKCVRGEFFSQDGTVITKYVEAWADLPDWGLV